MKRRSLLERVRLLGVSGLAVLQAMGRAVLFLGHALIGRSGTRNGFALLVKQLYGVGVLSLPIIIVAGIFIGMVLALQGYSILVDYGSAQAVGQMVALTLLRELGPVVTGLLFAGRAGSALTAEIGNMKSTEQISSLEMIGVDPLKYIIAPRLWAGFISIRCSPPFSVWWESGGAPWSRSTGWVCMRARFGPTCRTVSASMTMCSMA